MAFEKKLSRITRTLILSVMASTMMGNEGCQEQQTRSLRRRVQVGKISAPAIQLPMNQGSFDFQFVANAQMYDILRRTQSFSTSTIDPSKTYDPSGLDSSEAENFNQCQEVEDSQLFRKGLSAKSVISERAACLIDMPQGVVSGAILNFQLTQGGGATVSMTDIPLLPSLSVDFKRYELAMALQVTDPMIFGHYIATTAKQSYSNDLTAAASINFSGFSVGPRYYYNSPLRKVVDDAMTQSITDLKSQWDAAHPWYGMVLRNCDKSIYINAGNKTDAGVMVGDIVKIQNVAYRWEGDVCHSRLIGSTTNPEAVGFAQITSVGDTISVAKVIDNDPKYPYSREQVIKPGARVYMEKMVPLIPKKTAAK